MLLLQRGFPRLPRSLQVQARQTLDGWNATTREYDRDHLVHRYVGEQPPDHPAVSAAGVQLSYGALDRRSNQLARLLIAEGVGPDVVVALFLPRDSIDLIRPEPSGKS